MKRTYVMMFGFANMVAGGPLYNRNKIRYLEERGWEIVVFPITSGKVYIEELKRFEGFNFSFVHSNMAGIIFANLVYMWLWNNFEKANSADIFVIVLLSILVWRLTKSDTVLVEILFGMFLYSVIRFGKKDLSMLLIKISYFMIPMLMLFFLVTCNNYTGDFECINWLDKTLTGRIKFGAYACERWGMTVIGNGVNITRARVVRDSFWKLNGFTFDCIYTYFLFNFGWIWGVVLWILFVKLSKKVM